MESKYRYDIEGFAEELGISVQEISDLYSDFIESVAGEVKKIEELSKKEDWYEIKKVFHDIKGVSGNYRIMDVCDEASEINNILRNENYVNIKSLLLNFYILVENAFKEIRRFFSEKGIEI